VGCGAGGAALWAVDAPGGATVRGKLILHPGNPAVVETEDHRHITLEGDESTSKVLADQRLTVLKWKRAADSRHRNIF